MKIYIFISIAVVLVAVIALSDKTKCIDKIFSFIPPSEYKQIENIAEKIDFPDSSGKFATHEFKSWKSPNGKKLYLSFWKPFPARDGGPMKVMAEWPVIVDGKSLQIVETSMFMGSMQHVFVTYFNFKKPDSTAIFYASGLDRSEFTQILSTIKIAETRQNN